MQVPSSAGEARSEFRAMTLEMLRERREKLARDLASIEALPPSAGGLSARELITWRTRLIELEGRIARHSHK